MKATNTVILSIFLLIPNAICSEWFLEKSINGIEFWKHPDLKRTRILIQHQVTKNTYQPEFYQSKDFQEKLQENKKKTLSHFGIQKWEFKITDTKINKDSVKIIFEGSYDDLKSQKTYFIEKHYYHSSKVTQILFSSEEDRAQKNKEYFQLFFKQRETP